MGAFFLKNLTPIISGALVPFLALILNLIVRKAKGLPMTTGADLLLFAAVLDATMLATPDAFKGAVSNQYVVQQFNAVLIGMTFLFLVMWATNVLWLEKGIQSTYDPEKQVYFSDGRRGYWYVGGSIFFVIFATGLHFLVFALS